MSEPVIGVECGACGSGNVHFQPCGIDGCEWTIGFSCLACGAWDPITHPAEVVHG